MYLYDKKYKLNGKHFYCCFIVLYSTRKHIHAVVTSKV